MNGSAIAYGAISIVNAIATGRGSALGVELKTEAEVEVLDGPGEISVTISGEPQEETGLAREAVRGVLSSSLMGDYGAKVMVRSDIPIARGLKSSSAASNAIVLATLSALGKEADDMEAINMAVDASIRAGVSITGAFDDACASYFGGFVVTDNYGRRIMRGERAPEGLSVVLYVPEERAYTGSVDRNRLGRLRSVVEEAFGLALKGEYWKAMTLNGLIYSAALGYSSRPAVDAVCSGAFAAGLSGTGPTIAAVCREDFVGEIAGAWSGLPGSVIRSRVNNRKARVL